MEIKIEYNRPVQNDGFNFVDVAIKQTVNDIKDQLESMAAEIESLGIDLTLLYDRDEDKSVLIASGASDDLLEMIRKHLFNSNIRVKS